MAGKVVAPAIRKGKGTIPLSPEDKERWFWSKVAVKENGCWEWSMLIAKSGYGALRSGGKYVLAHRFAWILTFGPIPGKLNVLHRCDNRPCVNPAHLFLGTHLDNYADMRNKGREKKAVGEKQWFHKMTNESIGKLIEMRRSGITYASLAVTFGLHKATVYNICKGRTWKHLKICA